MLVNEPPSDDPDFFKGRALTYYGRWTYKYEEALGAAPWPPILIHKTEMASYPWEVVRNSNSGEKALIRNDAPQLKAAAWIQFDAARKTRASLRHGHGQTDRRRELAEFSPCESSCSPESAHGKQDPAVLVQ